MNTLRDIVVIGAPLGGATALAQVIGDLTAELDASVFVALHNQRDKPILLADVLNDRRGLRASVAIDGEPIERRRIYVAADDAHLTIDGGRVRVGQNRSSGPHPSIDRLFSSAAEDYTTRVIGVLLLHCRDDGALGLHAIRSRGGRTITHRNNEMPDEPKHPTLGESLSDAHLELEKIGAHVLHYAHGGNGERPPV